MALEGLGSVLTANSASALGSDSLTKI